MMIIEDRKIEALAKEYKKLCKSRARNRKVYIDSGSVESEVEYKMTQRKIEGILFTCGVLNIKLKDFLN